ANCIHDIINYFLFKTKAVKELIFKISIIDENANRNSI
ncbi:hypothetical protein MHK_008459, partial [Candidatus Magnetomorum sp. HK-1]